MNDNFLNVFPFLLPPPVFAHFNVYPIFKEIEAFPLKTKSFIYLKNVFPNQIFALENVDLGHKILSCMFSLVHHSPHKDVNRWACLEYTVSHDFS